MKSKTITGIVAALVIIIGAIIIANSSSSSSVKIVTPTPTAGISTSPTSGGYTIADVSKHKDASSCWTAINANVYDLTSWINEHPGGANAILSICGIDGTQAFMNQHGGQGRPEQELATFKIGSLSQ